MKATTFGGNPTRDENQKHLLPDDKLLRFLNIDINDENAVSKFCTNYCFIPRDLTNGLYEGFKKEHEVFIPIALSVLNHTVGEKEIEKINDELSGIKIQVALLTYGIAREINDELLDFPKGDGEKYDELKKFDEKQLYLNYKYPNTIADLYTSLIEKSKSKRPFKNCKQCGIFFTPSPRYPKQMFCSTTCKDKYAWNHR
jgi:hypothetical protein